MILKFAGYAILVVSVFALFFMRRRWMPFVGKNKALAAIMALGVLGLTAWFLIGSGPTAPTLEEIKFMDGRCAEVCKESKTTKCKSRKLKCSIHGTTCHFAPEGAGPRHRYRDSSENPPGIPVNWECWDGKTSAWDGGHFSFSLSETLK